MILLPAWYKRLQEFNLPKHFMPQDISPSEKYLGLGQMLTETFGNFWEHMSNSEHTAIFISCCSLFEYCYHCNWNFSKLWTCECYIGHLADKSSQPCKARLLHISATVLSIVMVANGLLEGPILHMQPSALNLPNHLQILHYLRTQFRPKRPTCVTMLKYWEADQEMFNHISGDEPGSPMLICHPFSLFWHCLSSLTTPLQLPYNATYHVNHMT